MPIATMAAPASAPVLMPPWLLKQKTWAQPRLASHDETKRPTPTASMRFASRVFDS